MLIKRKRDGGSRKQKVLKGGLVNLGIAV